MKSLGFESLDKDGLGDPEGGGNLVVRRLGLVGELREKMFEEGTRGFADGAEDAEGDGEEMAGGGEVLADVVALGLLAREGGRLRGLAGVGELRLDERIGDGEVEMQLLGRHFGNAVGERDVGAPGGLAIGLGHGDGELLGEGDVGLVESSSAEVANGVVGVDGAATFLAGTEVIAVGVERGALVLVEAEGAEGLFLVFTDVEEGSTKVALHGELVERRDEVLALAAVGESVLPGVGFLGLELEEESVEALIRDGLELGEEGIVDEGGEGGLGEGLLGAEGDLLARREQVVEGLEGGLSIALKRRGGIRISLRICSRLVSRQAR